MRDDIKSNSRQIHGPEFGIVKFQSHQVAKLVFVNLFFIEEVKREEPADEYFFVRAFAAEQQTKRSRIS